FGGRWAMVALSGRVIRLRDASQDVYLAGKTGKASKSVETKPETNGRQKQQDGEDARTCPFLSIVCVSFRGILHSLLQATEHALNNSIQLTDKPLFSVRRSSLVYAVLLYSIFCVSYAFVWRDQLGPSLNPSTNWDSRLFSLEALLALLPSAISPWVWMCTTNLRKVMWGFAEYQEAFLSVTNQHLRDRWSSRVRFLRGFVFVLFVVPLLLIIVGMIASKKKEQTKFISGDLNAYDLDLSVNAWYYLPAAYSATVSFFLILLFHTAYSLQLREAATALSEHLNQMRPGDTEGVRRAQKLWVGLRALYNDHPSLYLLDVFYLTHVFLLMLFSVYLCFALLSLGVLEAGASQVMWMLLLAFGLFQVSNRAHEAVTAMHGPVVSALDKLSMDAHDQAFFRAVTLFYKSVISRPARLSLSGFTSIDRPLFGSIVSLSVTYLVIMMQFRSDTSHPSSLIN
ncbi:Gustatory receptor 16, partial [Frankliniella occidentalis]